MKKVLVIWHDAYTRDGWSDNRSAIKRCRPPLVFKTIGWLFDKSKNHIVICHTKNKYQTMGRLHIPIGCVKKIKEL